MSVLYEIHLDNRSWESIEEYLKSKGYQSEKEMLDDVTNAVLSSDIVETIRRGDVVRIKDLGYRNDGKFMWDGEKAVSLIYDIDEYGSLPSCFTVLNGEFTLDWWEHTISHNSIVWIDFNPFAKELLENLKKIEIHEVGSIYRCASTSFRYEDVEYVVIIEPFVSSSLDELEETDTYNEGEAFLKMILKEGRPVWIQNGFVFGAIFCDFEKSIEKFYSKEGLEDRFILLKSSL